MRTRSPALASTHSLPRLSAAGLLLSALLLACSSSEDSAESQPTPADGGKGGGSGKGGSAGKGGSSGQGGAGVSGASGQSGQGGSAGAGQAGSAGQAGQGGEAGQSGASGQGGAGQSGASGEGGAGQSGASGQGGAGQSGASGQGGAGAAGGGAGAGGAASCESGLVCGGQGACCAVGDECLDGACVAACASGVRCQGVCCGDGQVCAGACVTPTEACQDSVDCGKGEFCEPSLLKCIPEGPSASACTFTKPAKPLNPQLKWSWTSTTIQPTFNQAVSAPLVADMDKDGTPDVIFTSLDSNGQTATAPGYLRLLDGKTGQEKWPASADVYKTPNRVNTIYAPALADLDGDGNIEVVAQSVTGDLMAFNPDGSLRWRSTRPDGKPYKFAGVWASAISIADMNGDGLGEVVMGGVIFGFDGVLISGDGRDQLGASKGTYPLSPGTSSIIADVDADGVAEVIGGNAVYRLDDTALWSDSKLKDGYPAIADLNGDGLPELVVISVKEIRVHNAITGAVLFTAPVPKNGTNPGPPVIADFDGDGAPEIGIQHAASGGCAFSTLEFDATTGLMEKWSTKLTSCSGYLTATAFDFNGDGEVEVIAHDDCRVAILKGSTGEVQLTLPASHNTWTEFVSVADVDGDGSADLLWSSTSALGGNTLDWNAYCGYKGGEKATRGLFVYSDPEGAWMPTRRIWNQQSYHITNIKIDGRLPKPEVASWGPEGFNNYRVSAQGKGVSNAPDLAVSLAAQLDQCSAGQVTLVASVQNKGSISAPAGIEVSFFQKPGVLLGTGKTTKALPPGSSESVTLVTAAKPGFQSFEATVDTAGLSGAVSECIEDNNSASIDQVTCDKI